MTVMWNDDVKWLINADGAADDNDGDDSDDKEYNPCMVYMVNVTIYSSTMDPSWVMISVHICMSILCIPSGYLT